MLFKKNLGFLFYLSLFVGPATPEIPKRTQREVAPPLHWPLFLLVLVLVGAP